MPSYNSPKPMSCLHEPKHTHERCTNNTRPTKMMTPEQALMIIRYAFLTYGARYMDPPECEIVDSNPPEYDIDDYYPPECESHMCIG